MSLFYFESRRCYRENNATGIKFNIAILSEIPDGFRLCEFNLINTFTKSCNHATRWQPYYGQSENGITAHETFRRLTPLEITRLNCFDTWLRDHWKGNPRVRDLVRTLISVRFVCPRPCAMVWQRLGNLIKGQTIRYQLLFHFVWWVLAGCF